MSSNRILNRPHDDLQKNHETDADLCGNKGHFPNIYCTSLRTSCA
ncbi:hypothetical protein AZE42_11411 [Rhizopogon vesiculosus]|uniref:Uncharacterized protein n=1 Tax=Rhizopogon vesiculosus TaxID=180088 RepID=A0A1J8PWB7_9AGAM|nr:hypothetical protein AZE42_11411 [Rhizopogon vesiculosus]